jgi:hypothetical protein
VVQSPPLRLSHLQFGKIDARNEVTTRDRKVLEHFRESFLQPSGIQLDDFRRGTRFFIYGMKGSGKTAFLRYLSLVATEEHCLSKFISFATQISDKQRETLFKEAGITIYEQSDADDPGQSAVNVWLLFVFKQIANLIEQNTLVFTHNRETRTFCELINKFHLGETKGLLHWLLNAAKSGHFKIKSKHFDAKLQGKAAEIEKEFTVDQIVEQCFNLLTHLSWEGKNAIYIFFDELNLSFSSRVQHRRDAVLIRDLIIAIDQVNNFLIENDKPVFVLAAARSEVLNALNIPTLEINKILSDRGAELRWYGQKAADDWPITRLLESKIHASEKLAGKKPSPDVYDQYFQRGIFGMTPKSLVVELTWCNPRDLIMLFGTAAENAYTEPRFGESVIDRVLEKFSEDAWNERVEELNVEYAKVEIDSIKKILLSFRPYFKADHFDQQAKTKFGDQNVKTLMTKKSREKILDDLYRVGIIGQSSKEPTILKESSREGEVRQLREFWAYRGDSNFDPTAWMIIHRGLWPQLRLGRIRPNPQTIKP